MERGQHTQSAGGTYWWASPVSSWFHRDSVSLLDVTRRLVSLGLFAFACAGCEDKQQEIEDACKATCAIGATLACPGPNGTVAACRSDCLATYRRLERCSDMILDFD